MSPPADSPDEPRDREELAAQLDELEATLTDLRSELRGEGRGPPQPPQLGDLLRFTEQYTIPTLIAMLEATIKSLELLQRTLRLADPARAAREEGEAARGRLDTVGSEAGRQLADALSELRTALAEADLPENPESRDVIADARSLTGEIEARLRDAEGTVSDQRDRERGAARRSVDDDTAASDGVMIDVGEDGDDTESEDNADEGSQQTRPDPEVDVDAELESIKSELDRSERALDEQANEENENERGDTADDDETAGGDDT